MQQSLPSPAHSETHGDNGVGSRKRQRTLSMQSNASSSKRSGVSDSPHGDTAHDLNGAIAESKTPSQSRDFSTEVSDVNYNFAGETRVTVANTTNSEKLKIVNDAKSRPLSIDETRYVVDRRWYRKFEKACTGEVDKEGGVEESSLPPVDNSLLLTTSGDLPTNLIEGVTVEYLPEDSWNMLESWYGQSTTPIPRKVIAKGIAREPSLELYPLRLFVLRLVAEVTEEPGFPVTIKLSVSDTVRKLAQVSKDSATSESTVDFRLWRLNRRDLQTGQCSLAELLADEAVLIDQTDRTLSEALVESGDFFAVEISEGGKWITDKESTNQPVSEAVTPPAETVAPVSITGPLFGAKNDFFANKFGKRNLAESTTNATNKLSAPNATTIVPRKQQTSPPGTIGLMNLGNTCFMNSAIQCLAHTKEIAEYFLTGVYADEINRDNPLGMQGQIADAFGALLHKIWAQDPVNTSYSPREFKQTLQRFAPQFSGYQQHDSQELLAFLLDGLHEDLNRVLKKPYVEKPDWMGGGDRELVELANKSWDGYMLRNDSMIVDLFQGQYQSTLVCPECHKVSITFDPFMYLTLPLPDNKKSRHNIYFIPWDNSKNRLEIPIEVPSSATFKEVRQILSKWLGIPFENLLTFEIFSGKFYKVLDDNTDVASFTQADKLVCFELPCNARMRRGYKLQEEDPLILPVLITPIHTNRNYTSSYSSAVGCPLIVVIDRQTSSSIDGVYNAVVDRLRRWAVDWKNLYKWEEGDSNSSSTEESPIRIPGAMPVDSVSVTEFRPEDGQIVTREALVPEEEGDIVDEKQVVLGMDEDINMAVDPILIPVASKAELFTLGISPDQPEYGIRRTFSTTTNSPGIWKEREDALTEAEPSLLRHDDILLAQFDENMLEFVFGRLGTQSDVFKSAEWERFEHPDFLAQQASSSTQGSVGLSLDDCMDAFVAEEELGEDDLWYCPTCKKHQRATKKFDLWKAPDVLVVHLKRFSNRGSYRDKIDTLVEFPIHDFNLEPRVMERQLAKRLAANGQNLQELNLNDVEEPLLYDLFGVDEHIGSLGGGHYLAYAENHLNHQWYHFDDSHVSRAKASDSINSNAYLLFYKRRTSRPLGGKTHEKITLAREKQAAQTVNGPASPKQLPTPPDDLRDATNMDLDLPSSFTDERKSIALPFGGPISLLDSHPSTPDSGPPPLEDNGFDSDRGITSSRVPYSSFDDRYESFDPSPTFASPASSTGAALDAGDSEERDELVSDGENPSTDLTVDWVSQPPQSSLSPDRQ